MVIIKFTENFEKELKKQLSKTEAIKIVKTLIDTKPSEGDFVAAIANVILKEKRLKTFRFYFVQNNSEIRYLSKEELKEYLIKFIGMSKKNNQQQIINKLKKELKEFGLNIK